MSGALQIATPPPDSFPMKGNWAEARRRNRIIIFPPITLAIDTRFEKLRNDP